MSAETSTRPHGAVHAYTVVGGGLVLAIAALTAVDVLGRYFFNSPINGAFDLIEGLMALATVWFMPQLSKEGQHVSVTLFHARAGSRLARVQGVVIECICTLVALLICWRLGVAAQEFQQSHEVTLVLEMPKAPILALSAGVAGLMALAHAHRLWLTLTSETGATS